MIAAHVLITTHFTGDNGRLVYSIVGGNEKEQFQISQNGTIITSKTLDRESKFDLLKLFLFWD
jgi:protocadherin Fat 4